MDIVEPANAGAVNGEPAGFAGWLRTLVMKLFGLGAPGPSQLAQPTASAGQEAGEDGEGAFILAPGGYRIHVPGSCEVGHSVGDMLPTVREGLSLLPPLPTVIIELLREIQDAKSTAASVAQVAASDPALAASLLRTANSAALGLARTITSVSEAVSYLGFGTVKAMVVRLRLDEVLMPKSEAGGRDAEDLWVHSLAVSYAAEALAQRVQGVDRGFVATLGLLHDIGKMAMLAQLPQESVALDQAMQADSSTDRLAIEAKVLGIDHAGLGANLAAKWKLPADLVQAIRWHHRPAGAFHPTDPAPLRKAVHIVQIANQLAKYCYPHADRMEIDQVPDEAFEMLGLEASMPKLLQGNIQQAISRAIFFASGNAKRPATTPRRFLRPLDGVAAARILTAQSTNEPRITEDDALIAEVFSPEARELKIQGESAPATRGATHVRFTCTAATAAVENCMNAAKSHQDEMSLSSDTRSVFSLIIKSLLPNLLAMQASRPDQTIEVAQLLQGRRLTLGVRALALATSRRAATPLPASAARRLAEADLASVLNLEWFDRIVVSADGSTVVFVGRE